MNDWVEYVVDVMCAEPTPEFTTVEEAEHWLEIAAICDAASTDDPEAPPPPWTCPYCDGIGYDFDTYGRMINVCWRCGGGKAHD